MCPYDKYGPVGWEFSTEKYCHDCIVKAAMKPGKGNGGNGRRQGKCNCAECRLKRIATARGIDLNEVLDQEVFPQPILYHNDLHADCGDTDREAGDVVCYSRCASCHEVIDGVSHLHGPDTCPTCDGILEPLISAAEERVWDATNWEAPDFKTWQRANPEGSITDYEGEFCATEVRGQGELFDASTYGE